MSENGKGAINSLDMLVECVKEKRKYSAKKSSLEFIECFYKCFDKEQAFGPDITREERERLGSIYPNDDNFWIFRENMRATGSQLDVYYTPLPMRFDILRTLRTDLDFHFVHMSVEDNGMLAYTPSIAYGKQDRQVRVKIGSYLSRFYGELLTQAQIKKLVDGSVAIEVEILDSDRIVEAYIQGPSSCMAGDEFESELDGIHPCSAYETPDWKIAVVRNKKGEITERALICVHDPENPEFVRCYGDGADSLKEKLQEMGYTKSGEWPNGARLRKIECSGGYVAPYLDGNQRYVGEGKEYFVIGGSEDFYFDSSSGYINTRPMVECSNCGDSYPEDEMDNDWEGNPVCSGCIENSFVHAIVNARGSQRLVHEEHVICCQTDDEYYLDRESVYESHGVHQCQVTGNFYHEDDMVLTDEGWVSKDNYTPPEQESLELEERKAA